MIADPRVTFIKDLTKRMLDYLKNLEGMDARCKDEAMKNYELAAMWAVKGLFVEDASGAPTTSNLEGELWTSRPL